MNSEGWGNRSWQHGKCRGERSLTCESAGFSAFSLARVLKTSSTGNETEMLMPEKNNIQCLSSLAHCQATQVHLSRMDSRLTQGWVNQWMVTNWSKVPPFLDHSNPWRDWLSWKKAGQSIMPWRSLTGLWWGLTIQQTICVLGNLRDLLSFCDLPILFLTGLSFIFSMQVLYCVTLSLEAIHYVDIDLFFLLVC